MNYFIGLSNEELDAIKRGVEQRIKGIDYDIERLKQEIKEKTKAKSVCKGQLESIEEARGFVSSIQYETIIQINAEEANEYIGPPEKRGYLYSSNYKIVVFYTISVLKCNKADIKKGRELITNSDRILRSNKEQILGYIQEAIKKYDVTKVWISKGVRVNTAEIKKMKKGIEIIVEGKDGT